MILTGCRGASPGAPASTVGQNTEQSGDRDSKQSSWHENGQSGDKISERFRDSSCGQQQYMYTAIAPIPLASFAGEPSQNIGKSFLKSYAAVCLEGAVIVLACIIFSVFASSPPSVDSGAAAASMVWTYIGELVFNMLILVGSVKMADRVVHEMLGL